MMKYVFAFVADLIITDLLVYQMEQYQTYERNVKVYLK